MLATGHYAHLLDDKKRGYHAQLARSSDMGKDQCYFLAEVKQEALNNTIFPLAFCTKEEVRILASHFDLPVAKKKDSTVFASSGSVIFGPF